MATSIRAEYASIALSHFFAPARPVPNFLALGATKTPDRGFRPGSVLIGSSVQAESVLAFGAVNVALAVALGAKDGCQDGDGAVRRLFAAHVPHFDLDEPSTPAAIAFSHGWSPFTWSVRPLDHDPIPRENLSGGAALMKHDS